MRTSRKKLLRLDEKTCYRDDVDCGEEDDDYRSDYNRKPHYKQSSKEGFKCKHCRRFVCPPHSGVVIVTIARSASIRCMSMTGNQETG